MNHKNVTPIFHTRQSLQEPRGQAVYNLSRDLIDVNPILTFLIIKTRLLYWWNKTSDGRTRDSKHRPVQNGEIMGKDIKPVIKNRKGRVLDSPFSAFPEGITFRYFKNLFKPKNRRLPAIGSQ
jgi:hypothetical protein